MNNKYIVSIVVGLLMISVVSGFMFGWWGKKSVSQEWPMMDWNGRDYGMGSGMGGVHGDIVSDFEKEDVSEEEIDALVMAINEEYKARAMYANMISQLGDFMPASRIIQAEESHIDLLEDLFLRYELEIPEDEWRYSIEYADYADACSDGAQAEIDNIGVYNDLYSSVDNRDIYEVFSLLQWGSSMHLRAFQMCGGSGYRMGMRGGMRGY